VTGGAPGALDDPVDVLVCGGGMAGLCAAVSAAQAGARPLVIEKGAELGGSMLMSGGSIWTAPTMAIMESWVPGGDRVGLVQGRAAGRSAAQAAAGRYSRQMPTTRALVTEVRYNAGNGWS
jgi:NADPH-dependent 2,4-dienoyl-CoA reductase/sulfur reductase-like enzyme